MQITLISITCFLRAQIYLNLEQIYSTTMFVLNGTRKMVPLTSKNQISNFSPIKVVQFPSPPLECTNSRIPGCSEQGLLSAQFMAFSGNTRDFWVKKQVFGFCGVFSSRLNQSWCLGLIQISKSFSLLLLFSHQMLWQKQKKKKDKSKIKNSIFMPRKIYIIFSVFPPPCSFLFFPSVLFPFQPLPFPTLSFLSEFSNSRDGHLCLTFPAVRPPYIEKTYFSTIVQILKYQPVARVLSYCSFSF